MKKEIAILGFLLALVISFHFVNAATYERIDDFSVNKTETTPREYRDVKNDIRNVNTKIASINAEYEQNRLREIAGYVVEKNKLLAELAAIEAIGVTKERPTPIPKPTPIPIP
jgi:hypothetical protein